MLKKINGKMLYLVVGVLCALLASGSIGVGNASSLFSTPLRERLGVGRGPISILSTLNTIILGFISPRIVKLSKKIRLNYIMVAGLFINLIATVLIANCTNFYLYFFFLVIKSIGSSCTSYMFITSIINNWFEKDRSTITGFLLGFSGVTGAIISPIVSNALVKYGYTITYIGTGVATFILSLPCALLCPSEPELIDRSAYGADEVKDTDSKAKKDSISLDVPLKEKSYLFVLAALTVVFYYGVASCSTYFTDLFVEKGMEYTEALSFSGKVLSAALVGNVAFKLVLGFLIDRIGLFKGVLSMCVLDTIGVLIIMFAPNNAQLLMIAGGLLLGTCYSVASVGYAATVRYVYGNQQYAMAYSETSLVNSWVTAVKSPVIGWVFDLTGSAMIPVFVSALSAALSPVGLAVLMKRAQKEKENEQIDSHE